MALLAVLLAWRYQRWFAWVQIPFATGLVLGTVYLRHHWVVDILAGFVMTFLAFWAGPRIEDWWTDRSAGAGADARPVARQIEPRIGHAEHATHIGAAPGATVAGIMPAVHGCIR